MKTKIQSFIMVVVVMIFTACTKKDEIPEKDNPADNGNPSLGVVEDSTVDVYVVGRKNDNDGYWKNKSFVDITPSGVHYPEKIAVADDNTVYLLSKKHPVYFKGKAEVSFSDKICFMKDLFVENGVVHIIGSIRKTTKDLGVVFQAGYWINGKEYNLQDNYYEWGSSSISDIYVRNGKAYLNAFIVAKENDKHSENALYVSEAGNTPVKEWDPESEIKDFVVDKNNTEYAMTVKDGNYYKVKDRKEEFLAKDTYKEEEENSLYLSKIIYEEKNDDLYYFFPQGNKLIAIKNPWKENERIEVIESKSNNEIKDIAVLDGDIFILEVVYTTDKNGYDRQSGYNVWKNKTKILSEKLDYSIYDYASAIDVKRRK